MGQILGLGIIAHLTSVELHQFKPAKLLTLFLQAYAIKAYVSYKVN